MRYDENGQDRSKFLMIAIAIAIAMFALYMLAFQRDPISLPETPLERPVEQAIQEPVPSEVDETIVPEAQSEAEAETENGLSDEFEKSSFTPPEGRNGISIRYLTTGDNTGNNRGDEVSNKTPYQAPLWIRNSVPVNVPAKGRKVAIIIDDLGENKYWTQQTLTLPAPVTLAFLPYPEGVKSFVETGRENGHEIMVHMPMEPVNKDLDKGSYVLRVDMTEKTLEDILQANLAAFDGYVGINNHMGSGLTQDTDAMTTVMHQLQEKGLLFVDSRTIASSVAGELARANQIPTIDRDVFIDHVATKDAVAAALAKIEEIAQEYGSVVAIGHPKKVTIEALKSWIPTLAAKNIYLVPVSALVKSDLHTVQVKNIQSQEAAEIIN